MAFFYTAWFSKESCEDQQAPGAPYVAKGGDSYWSGFLKGFLLLQSKTHDDLGLMAFFQGKAIAHNNKRDITMNALFIIPHKIGLAKGLVLTKRTGSIAYLLYLAVKKPFWLKRQENSKSQLSFATF